MMVKFFTNRLAARFCKFVTKIDECPGNDLLSRMIGAKLKVYAEAQRRDEVLL